MADHLTSIILPTCGRPARVRDLFRQLVASVGDNRVEYVPVVDEDETTADVLKAGFAEFGVSGQLVWSEARTGPMAAWNRGALVATGDVLVFFADDLWPEPGWLTEALDVLDNDLNGHGMVGFNDLYTNGEIWATHFLMSRSWVVAGNGGVLAIPQYVYNHCDLESSLRAQRAGVYRWAPRAIVRHDHPDNGRRPADEHFKPQLVPRDAMTFSDRICRGFPDDFPAVVSA